MTLHRTLYTHNMLFRRVVTLLDRKPRVLWAFPRKLYGTEVGASYLNLAEMGIHDHADLEKSAELVRPSRGRRNVLIVQPIYKTVQKNALKTTTELQVQEAHALISTMRSRFRVCDTLCLSTSSERKKLFFGKGMSPNFRAFYMKSRRST